MAAPWPHRRYGLSERARRRMPEDIPAKKGTPEDVSARKISAKSDAAEREFVNKYNNTEWQGPGKRPAGVPDKLPFKGSQQRSEEAEKLKTKLLGPDFFRTEPKSDMRIDKARRLAELNAIERRLKKNSSKGGRRA